MLRRLFCKSVDPGWFIRPILFPAVLLISIQSVTCMNFIAANGPPGDSDEGWSMERGDAAATGAVSRTLPADLSVEWKYEAEKSVQASPVIAAGRVFIADDYGTLHAISLLDGGLIWKQTTELGFMAAPAADKEMVVVGDLDGVVYAFDAESGTRRWTFQTGGEISAGATILTDQVLVSSQDGILYSLKRNTGELAWQYETGDQIRCRATVAGERTFLGGCDGRLHIVSITNGTSAAEPIPLDGPTGSTPAVLGDKAFLPTQTGSILAFNWKTGKQLWSYINADRPEEFRNSAAVSGNHVVVATKNRAVISLHPETGEVQWTTTLRKRADGSPVIAGEDVWVAATDGRLYRLSLSDGKEKWQHEERGSFVAPPALVGDRLIAVNDDGTVFCFGPGKTAH